MATGLHGQATTSNTRQATQAASQEEKDMRVGIIGDTHLPYELEGYLEFCQESLEAWDVDTIVHIGDMFDNHSLSFHDSEPMLHNVICEY